MTAFLLTVLRQTDESDKVIQLTQCVPSVFVNHLDIVNVYGTDGVVANFSSVLAIQKIQEDTIKSVHYNRNISAYIDNTYLAGTSSEHEPFQYPRLCFQLHLPKSNCCEALTPSRVDIYISSVSTVGAETAAAPTVF